MDTPISRVILIVLDSVGIGALPDADCYGDAGSNTLAHTAQSVGGLHLPHMAAMGLGCIAPIEGVPVVEEATGAYGRMAEASAGKDTTIGHWEIAGQVTSTPLPTYPEGFPVDLIRAFERESGRPVIGNRVASGTVIIEALGSEHARTGAVIVYTSADSVFQIAAHEGVVPVEELYAICRTARRLLVGKHNVGRVIARPFVGEPGAYRRTDRRRDFSAEPPSPTLLDLLVAGGRKVLAVGKIEDIFAGRGITRAVHTHDNMDGLDVTCDMLREHSEGLVFVNLVDFDMRYGHRNNAEGYARALEAVDRRLPNVMALMREGDVLVLTADHGCDPTTPSTDHSREYVPLLVYGAAIRPGVNLGTRSTFADLGATVAEWLSVDPTPYGASFSQLLQRG